ncbi:histidine-specific methyltransferase [Obelidium mucronatum]|nr:histidine-specific methyltransferase [Obelidium mucronatum]
MEKGDTFLCGIDRRNPASVVKLAYDDPLGVTRDFVMNGLRHVERMWGHEEDSLLRQDMFEYVSLYNAELGRHEAYYRSLDDQCLVVNEESPAIQLEKGELVMIEYSVKYDAKDIHALMKESGLVWVKEWVDTTGCTSSNYGKETVAIRSIPTLVLYDDRGLDIYDKITYVEEYYLTNAEMQIFMDQGDEIMETCVGDGGVLIELGVGSMRKTKYLLDSIVKQGKSVTYYALDLSEQSLSSSLTPLAESYPTIQFIGLLGTYDDSLSYIQTNIPRPKDSTRTILWLGSSIGNYTRQQAAAFLRNVTTLAMETGDTFLCGIDRRNAPEIVKLAYDDPKKITRDFIMNGLKNTEHILGYAENSLFQQELFEYVSIYNDVLGRHEAYYRSLEAQVLEIQVDGVKHEIALEKGELINVEYSTKYSAGEVQTLVNEAGFYWASQWTDKTERYDMHCFQKSPFSLMGVPGLSMSEKMSMGIPTVAEYDQIFKTWDTIALTMISPEGYLEKPISLRHPYIFYVGHLPAFMDIQLSRCLKEPFTEPAYYTEIFERGIDPDVEDPNKCHAHSKVPDSWPELSEILKYAESCKQRLRKILVAHECGDVLVSGPLARILWIAYEHYAMHLETFLYMLVQSPNIQPPKGFIAPPYLFRKNPSPVVPAPEASLLPFSIPAEACTRIQSRQVTIGEYRNFLLDTNNNQVSCEVTLRPESWNVDSTHVKTAFGLVEIERVLNWPVFVSAAQASSYAEWLMELVAARKYLQDENETASVGNFGFMSWVPRDVSEGSGVVGNGWELTSTCLEEYEGYEKSVVYPGYSSDFFDGKHDIVLGGSWATAPRMALRSSFRNWYQRVYPYVFSGFRLVADDRI